MGPIPSEPCLDQSPSKYEPHFKSLKATHINHEWIKCGFSLLLVLVSCSVSHSHCTSLSLPLVLYHSQALPFARFHFRFACVLFFCPLINLRRAATVWVLCVCATVWKNECAVCCLYKSKPHWDWEWASKSDTHAHTLPETSLVIRVIAVKAPLTLCACMCDYFNTLFARVDVHLHTHTHIDRHTHWGISRAKGLDCAAEHKSTKWQPARLDFNERWQGGG